MMLHSLAPLAQPEILLLIYTSVHGDLGQLIDNHHVTDNRLKTILDNMNESNSHPQLPASPQMPSMSSPITSPSNDTHRRPIPKDISFSGRVREDVIQFTARLEAFQSYNNITNDQLLNIIPLILKSRAFAWY